MPGNRTHDARPAVFVGCSAECYPAETKHAHGTLECRGLQTGPVLSASSWSALLPAVLEQQLLHGDTFSNLMARFDKLYKRKIFVHHYTQYMDAAGFDEAAECLNSLIADYRAADNAASAPVVRMKPRGLSFL
eukprot:GHUV01037615.1.p1 GENE.GHUV01037615.1~~GHUV01037615.1.p1  ORF type:complete len:133 (+),score=33.23 GHUV01037615.1:1099-1497(+)